MVEKTTPRVPGTFRRYAVSDPLLVASLAMRLRDAGIPFRIVRTEDERLDIENKKVMVAFYEFEMSQKYEQTIPNVELTWNDTADRYPRNGGEQFVDGIQGCSRFAYLDVNQTADVRVTWPPYQPALGEPVKLDLYRCIADLRVKLQRDYGDDYAFIVTGESKVIAGGGKHAGLTYARTIDVVG